MPASMQPFGLPNRNANHALAYMKHADLGSSGLITSGADEISGEGIGRQHEIRAQPVGVLHARNLLVFGIECDMKY